MGLDMYAYRLSKCEGFDKLSIEDVACLPANILAFEKLSAKTEDITPLLTKVTLLSPRINNGRLAEKLGVSEDDLKNIFVSAYFDKEVHFSLYEGKETYTLSIEDYRSCFDNVPTDMWLVEFEKIGYWRKDYDLEEEIYELYREETDRDIDNCGYYRCNGEMVDAMYESGGLYSLPKEEEIDEGRIFYHEWY